MLKGPGYIEMRKREKNGTRRPNEIVIINAHIPYLRELPSSSKTI